MSARAWSRLASIACAGAFVVAARDADAGGLQVSDRGVRPLGRGGAFTAGADDLGAIWYNPAGIAEAGTSILGDMNMVFFSGEYTRRSMVSDAENGAQFERTFPTVQGSNAFLPIPTVAGSYAFGDKKQYTVAAGLFGPQAIAPTWPDGGPQRYSLIDQKGSALVFLGAWFAYAPVPWLEVGAGPMVLTGNYSAAIAFNANPRDRLLGAPEDRSYDAVGQQNAGIIFAPGANGGVILKPEKHIRVGASVLSPFTIRAPAKLLLALPTAAPFDEARVVGDEALLRFKLPWVLRLGVEGRPIPDLKIELAYSRDFWSRSQGFEVVPRDVNIYGIKGFPSPFAVSPIVIPLNFHDTNTYRLGAEYRIRHVTRDIDVEPRAGVLIDEAAAPTQYLSVLTFDTNRVHASLGASVHFREHWRFDALYMHTFASSVDVDPRTAAVAGINPVPGNPTPVGTVNGGHYSSRYETIGIGVNYKFE
jgi:long-chain fatty acid transport protein